jgi:hypothetical protein
MKIQQQKDAKFFQFCQKLVSSIAGKHAAYIQLQATNKNNRYKRA